MKEQKKSSTILIAAGGTGGDLFPAIAIMEELHKRFADCNPIFIGSPDRIESRIVPQRGYRFFPLKSLEGFRGLSSAFVKIPFTIAKAFSEIKSIVKEYNPACILCGGNYISFPAGLYAILKNIPLIIIEPNARPGKTNAFLGKYARIIITAFEETAQFFPEKSQSAIRYCGNPLRSSFVYDKPTRISAAKEFGINPDMKTLLVFGGSLGARSINQAIVKLIDRLSESGVQILWQTGREFIVNRNLPKNVHVMPFIENMSSAYAIADLVICRSGGGTVAELALCGKPSILIPLPVSANNEQAENAKTLEEHGAAIVIHDNAIATELEYALDILLKNDKKVEEMGIKAAELGKPNAAKDAADIIAQFLQ